MAVLSLIIPFDPTHSTEAIIVRQRMGAGDEEVDGEPTKPNFLLDRAQF
jgi:hypothetical protein